MKHIINMSLSALAAGSVWAAEPDIKAVVRADQPGHAIPETLYGIPAYELSLRHVRRGDAAFTARVIFSGCLPAR